MLMPNPEFHAQQRAAASAFGADMLACLRERPHAISPKYFYDVPGSALFDAICDLPEYYPTRTETAILERHAPAMAACMGADVELVEFGAGSLRKVRLLLQAMEQAGHPVVRYLPIDISGEHLQQSAEQLRRAHAGLDVLPVTADYSAELLLPPLQRDSHRRVGFFPGSTLGNFTPGEALGFLQRAARLLRGGGLLLGADLVKEPSLLHAAYNDAQGVTAAFNLNLLARANAELMADFDLGRFAHSAFYNAPLQRIEMHLMSRCLQQVSVAGHSFTLEQGETLHTENSYKFTLDGLRRLARQAGFEPGAVWTDAQQQFCLIWLQSPPLP